MRFLMSGDTSDLKQIGIAPKIVHVLQHDFRVEGITLEDVCRYMGIKRTNANRTKSKYREVHLDKERKFKLFDLWCL